MSPRIWLMAARPRTLPAAIAPVLVGSAAAYWQMESACLVDGVGGPGTTTIAAVVCEPDFRWLAFVAALVGSIFIQVGTNLANDYSDAKRGADSADRLGPVRVTSAGLVAPRRVMYATWLAFAVAVGAGVYLATVAGPLILAVGAVSILAGVLYTGGPRPYGYAGMGEVFVFLFFGLVAVNGSYYVQLEELDAVPLLLSVPVGLLATAILLVNNVRDIETDRRAGKRTLAVRIGREGARALYTGTCAGAFAILALTPLLTDAPAHVLLALLSAPLTVAPLRIVRSRSDGPSLNRALAATGVLLAAFSALVAAGLLAGA